MKKAIVLFAALALTTSLSSAQVRFGAGAQAGISISSFDKSVKDYYGLGYGFGAHGDINVGKYFTGRLNFDYHMFGIDSKKVIDAIAAENSVAASDLKLEGLTASAVGITLNGMGKIPTKSIVTPYAVAGFGMHILSVSDPKLTYQGQPVTIQWKTESRTKFGINFGAGADFAVSKGVNVGGDFRYVLIFSKDDTEGYENNAHMPITAYVTVFFN